MTKPDEGGATKISSSCDRHDILSDVQGGMSLPADETQSVETSRRGNKKKWGKKLQKNERERERSTAQEDNLKTGTNEGTTASGRRLWPNTVATHTPLPDDFNEVSVNFNKVSVNIEGQSNSNRNLVQQQNRNVIEVGVQQNL